MPWEKTFDEESAVDQAMLVFWQKGFEPASISGLLKGTGLTRGSLYNTFGGKRQLFVRALTKYDRDFRQALLAELEALDQPKQGIAAFYDGIVANTVADQDRKDCFIFNTALEVSLHDEEVNEIPSKALREIEGFFRRSIEVGQMRGEITDELDPEDSAKALLALIVSFRVLGRGAFAADALQKIVGQGKRLVGA